MQGWCSSLEMQDRLTDSKAALVAEMAGSLGRVLSVLDICQSGFRRER
jgi:hypothetical protein